MRYIFIIAALFFSACRPEAAYDSSPDSPSSSTLADDPDLLHLEADLRGFFDLRDERRAIDRMYSQGKFEASARAYGELIPKYESAYRHILDHKAKFEGHPEFNLKWFEERQAEAIEGLDLTATNYAYQYWEGEGVTQSYENAASLVQSATELGGCKAQYFLGYMHYTGKGMPQSYEEAAKLYTKSTRISAITKSLCDSGRAEYRSLNRHVAYFTALMNYHGEGLDQNYPLAALLFKELEYHPPSANALATMHYHGLGVNQSYDTALVLYSRPAGQGYAPSQVNLACLYAFDLEVEDAKKQADVWIDQAKMLGAEFELTQQNCRKAHNIQLLDLDDIRDRAENGDATAQYKLGLFYKDSVQFPFGKRGSIASYWLNKAAMQNHVGAQYEIGKDPNALKWLLSAADGGLVPAQYQLGEIFRRGEGPSQSYEKAFLWYQKAADAGMPLAHKKLAEAYLMGEGTIKSRQKYYEHLKQAARLGDGRARRSYDQHMRLDCQHAAKESMTNPQSRLDAIMICGEITDAYLLTDGEVEPD